MPAELLCQPCMLEAIVGLLLELLDQSQHFARNPVVLALDFGPVGALLVHSFFPCSRNRHQGADRAPLVVHFPQRDQTTLIDRDRGHIIRHALYSAFIGCDRLLEPSLLGADLADESVRSLVFWRKFSPGQTHPLGLDPAFGIA